MTTWRARVLQLVQKGRLTPEQAAALLESLDPTESIPDPWGVDAGRTPEAASAPSRSVPAPGCLRTLTWTLTVVGGGALLAVGLWAWSGPSFWVSALCLFPLGVLGLLALGLAWSAWRGVWLAVEIRQPPGEWPQRLRFAFPLPLAWLPWVVEGMRRTWPERLPLDGATVRDVLRVLREDPLWLTVDEEDGTQVRVWLGHGMPQTL